MSSLTCTKRSTSYPPATPTRHDTRLGREVPRTRTCSLFFVLCSLIFILSSPVSAQTCYCITATTGGGKNECLPTPTKEECAAKNKPGSGSLGTGGVACAFYNDNNCGGKLDAKKQPEGQTTAPPSPAVLNLTPPALQIPLPTLPELAKVQTVKAGDVVIIPWIGQYIAAVYKWAVGISVILAAAMLVIAGVVWLTAGGDAGRVTRAKEMIASATVGLVLMVGSYLVLVTLNPDLVKFKGLEIQTVIPAQLIALPPDLEEDTELETPPEAMPPEAFKIVYVKSPYIEGSVPVGQHMAEDIKIIAEKLFQQTQGQVKLKGGGFRKLESQVSKFEKSCVGKNGCSVPVCNPYGKDGVTTENGNIAVKPDAVPNIKNCPHTSGAAIDVMCSTSKGYFSIDVPCHLKLEQIFKEQGFCRLASEPWHFEKPQFSKTCVHNWQPGVYMWKGQKVDYSSCTGTFSSYPGSGTPSCVEPQS